MDRDTFVTSYVLQNGPTAQGGAAQAMADAIAAWNALEAENERIRKAQEDQNTAILGDVRLADRRQPVETLVGD
jgi:hypothetical protein